MASNENSWWNSLVKTAKEKSLNAFEIIKTDLAEFTSTMTSDANSLFNQTSSETDEKASTTTTTINSNQSEINKRNRFTEELEAIQANQDTYLDTQIETNEEFINWITTFNIDEHKATISDILIENSAMRLLYSQIVPAQISNQQFWSRYLFKVNQLEEEHQKRVKLLERVSNKTPDQEEGPLDWDDEDQSNKKIEPTNADENSNTNKEVEQDIQPIEEKIKTEISKSEDGSQNLGDEWEQISNHENNQNVDDSKQIINSEQTDNVTDKVNLKKDEWDDWDA